MLRGRRKTNELGSGHVSLDGAGVDREPMFWEIGFLAIAGLAGFTLGRGQGNLVDGIVTAVLAMTVVFIFIMLK